MEARKLNKVYQIDKSQADVYVAQGYDLYEGEKLVKRGAGRPVPLSELEKVTAELKKAKAELEKLKAKKEQ